VAIIVAEEETVVDSGIELIIIIKEDHAGGEIPEKIIREITQEVLSIRIIFRVFWMKTNIFSIIIIGIYKLYSAITKKYFLSSWTKKTIGVTHTTLASVKRM
jgi:hypothetical protein